MPTPRRRLLARVAVFAAAISLGHSVDRAAHIVTLHVTVLPARGAGVTALRAGDIAVTSDGMAMRLVSVAEDRTPLSLILLFDVSASEPFGDVESLALVSDTVDHSIVGDVEHEFVGRIGADDEVRIGSFAEQLTLSSPFTHSPADLRAALSRAFALPKDERFGPSPIWDSVDVAVDAVGDRPGRRAILLVTDGKSTGDRLGRRNVAFHAAIADVAICIVAEANLPRDALQFAAEDTGGLYLPDAPVQPVTPSIRPSANGRGQSTVWAREKPHPGPLLAHILDTLHRSYRVEFECPFASGGVHTVEVRAGSDRVVLVRHLYGS